MPLKSFWGGPQHVLKWRMQLMPGFRDASRGTNRREHLLAIAAEATLAADKLMSIAAAALAEVSAADALQVQQNVRERMGGGLARHCR